MLARITWAKTMSSLDKEIDASSLLSPSGPVTQVLPSESQMEVHRATAAGSEQCLPESLRVEQESHLKIAVPFPLRRDLETISLCSH